MVTQTTPSGSLPAGGGATGQGPGASEPPVAVVTGATSGIGLATARALAVAGFRLALVGRDPLRLDRALADVRRLARAPVEGYLAELTSVAEVRRLAGELSARFPRLAVLVNNAGALYLRRSESVEGVERTFALNVLTPFLLTESLLPSLRAAGGARVVNVASAAHRSGHLNLGDLEGRAHYSGWSAYAQSKLALILLTEEFARREPGEGVTFNSCHPGFVRSRYGLNNPAYARVVIRLLAAIGGIPPEKGARVVTYLAVSPDVAAQSGGYYVKDHRVAPSPRAQDPAAARQIWDAVDQRLGSISETAPSGPHRP